MVTMFKTNLQLIDNTSHTIYNTTVIINDNVFGGVFLSFLGHRPFFSLIQSHTEKRYYFIFIFIVYIKRHILIVPFEHTICRCFYSVTHVF